MSDPDRSRPAVPDPQQDRHVSFPDDDATPGGPPTFGTNLPPQAWAPRQSTRESSPAPAPSILTTPPVRPEPRRRRPRWPALLLVPPLLLGLANGQDSDSVTDGCPSFGDAGPGVSDCVSFDGTGDGSGGAGPGESVVGVWTQDVTASTTFAPMLGGAPDVSPVPADATSLTVEVVSTASSPSGGVVAGVDVTSGGMVLDGHQGLGPYAVKVKLHHRPSELRVTATVMTGPGTIQCRVYAGGALVAIDTSTTTATCTPAL